MNIGDVNSQERGSGARFSTGKVRLDYVPARVIHSLYSCGMVPLAAEFAATRLLLERLANFEERVGNDREELVAALDFSLRPVGGIERWRDVTACFDFGAGKYAPWNWAKGMAWSIPIACVKRHAVKILEGEKLDDESGLSHFGHIGCNLVMLLHYLENYPEGDDRPARECFAQDDEDLFNVERYPVEMKLPGSVFDLSLLDHLGGPLEDSEEIVSPETGDTVAVDVSPEWEHTGPGVPVAGCYCNTCYSVRGS